MLGRLIEYSVKNKFLVLLSTVILIGGGVYSLINTPLDAIPDLSDVQVIIFTEYPGQAPQVVEDQVTYPLTTAMLAVPYAKVVRGYSFFGFSFVYIIFEDGTDMYWARSRVLEYLNFVAGRLPRGVTPQLGPDATGVGWVFEYQLEDKSGRHDLSELRSIQDWYLRYELQTVPGVSEVASLGGFVKQYQVEVDPNKLAEYNIPLQKVRHAIMRSNNDVGGRLIEMAEMEYMVRGLGYIKSIEDLKRIAVGVDADGTPIYLEDVAEVHLGPELRRGIAESNGEGEVVGGIVVMRYGENALDVIEGVKKKLEELKKGLPEGVEIKIAYDRSDLIHRAVETLKEKLVEESLIVAAVCMIFLFHMRSALVAILTLPVGILMAFIVMHAQGINANIMSLGGIAIAIGAMVDAAIVMIENAHKHLEHDAGKKPHWEIIVDAAKEVGPALFFSLLIITLSFLPVFTLEAQEGRLFMPLAFTKTYSMAAAALLAVTLVPILMGYFIRETDPRRKSSRLTHLLVVGTMAFLAYYLRDYGLWVPVFLGIMIVFYVVVEIFFLKGRIPEEDRNPLNRFLIRIYHPAVSTVLRWKWTTITIGFLLLILTFFPFKKLVLDRLDPQSPIYAAAERLDALFPLEKIGGEFMPPLYEGDLLYMPTTLPGISVTTARTLLQQTDKIIAAFPEVHHVFGKIGRAESATDPAPLSMIETVIRLKPEEEWRDVTVERWYSKKNYPEFLKKVFRKIWPEKRKITVQELTDELEKAIKFPGVTNAWTMPIKTRVDMLSTGIKTPVGIKIAGDDLNKLQEIGKKVEAIIRTVPGTLSAYAERAVGGNYVDFAIRRNEIARYGLTVGDVQDIIMSAVGGMNITYTVEGLERYPVNLRYPRELRDNIEALRRVLVPTPRGEQIPLEQLADIVVRKGPPGIKSENARLNAWVYVDITGVDVATYVKAARETLDRELDLPAGYSITWSGQYEYMERAQKRLQLVVPVTLLIVFILLYLNFRNITESLIVMLSLPFALVGGVWLVYLLDYNMSIAVGVGFIALAGVAAEIGVIMIMYLDHALERARRGGNPIDVGILEQSIIEGAALRVRPIAMTVSAIIGGLLPIMWSHGTGSQVMKRIAAPMVGGMVSATILTLLMIPAIYRIWRGWGMRGARRAAAPAAPAAASSAGTKPAVGPENAYEDEEE
ncbi:MAG: efflux RND transporter permease subunit [Candidatus Hydrogenedentota bacterium]|nr:MAG: efflux RND transporter permease subunit [Candidatus Hydrogenedentota bacterium]